jgi:hypothetical protein
MWTVPLICGSALQKYTYEEPLVPGLEKLEAPCTALPTVRLKEAFETTCGKAGIARPYPCRELRNQGVDDDERYVYSLTL